MNAELSARTQFQDRIRSFNRKAHPRERGFWVLATAACLLVGIGLLLRQLRK